MNQEEHVQRCAYSSSGGGSSGGGSGGGGGGGGCNGGGSGSSCRSSKKVKQKKVPQRGLGVAQLEKIRLEEQQKKDAALKAGSILPPNPIVSPSDSSSCLAISCPSFRPSISPGLNSIPLRPPSPSDLPSPSSLYRPAPLIPNVDVFHPSTVQLSKPLNVVGAEVGSTPIPGSGHGGNWPRLWSGEYNLEGEKQRSDHQGVPFRYNVNLPYESSAPLVPHTSVMQRSCQFPQPSSSSMMNESSLISCSSIQNFHMEPPSNQSFRGNNYTPLWQEEEKMVGMKRSYPFSLETPPAPTFRGRFHPSYVTSVSRSDESASCSNGGTGHTEPGSNKHIREGPSNSSALSEKSPGEVIRETGGLNGDFLTLAPPAAASSNWSSKHSSAPQGHESSKLTCMPSQETSKYSSQRPGPSSSNEATPFSLFPTTLAQSNQAAAHIDKGNHELGESIDLNLKL